MINTPNASRFLGNIIFSKEEAYSLSKIRIIKKNLVHVHGFPQSLANSYKLCQPEFFGQYGKISKTLLTSKINPETKRKTYSAYITFSNEKEAAFAILAVDSLLIEGKIIRAFFGTTKYCNNFLNNIPCKNFDKCMFLHKLVKDKDIIIDSETVFSYNEHLGLAKNIIKFYNPETKNIVQTIPKMQKTIFPNIDFIFLDENEKENYFNSKNISYIKSNNDNNEKAINMSSINNSNLDLNKFSKNKYNNFIYSNKEQNSFFFKNNCFKNNSIGNLNPSLVSNCKINDLLNTPIDGEKNNIFINSNDPFFLHKIFQKSIKHILSVKPFFIKLTNNIPLKELELDYFKNELKKNGNNFYTLFEGCLDCINEKQ